jgi:hypothetical protein
MLTFFTTAKPFEGHNGIIQKNALKSWKLLAPDVEVILFGDEVGAAETSAELGLRHIPRVERHESGMKYLDYILREAQAEAHHRYLCYSNCDIVQTKDFRRAFELCKKWREQFLMVARRWDTDVTVPLDFSAVEWGKKARELALSTGRQQNGNFVDFFVFPKGLYLDAPALVVGRSYWDHWLVWKALHSGVPVIDATRFLVAIHQNHDYGYHPQGKQGTNQDALAQRNKKLSGDGKNQRSIYDATHAMTAGGRIFPTPFRRQFHTLGESGTRQGWLEHTLWIRRRLGLQRKRKAKLDA